MTITDKRRSDIIECLVSTYLETGKPVSSGMITAQSGLSVSSATIRNIMKELERDGYLSQPHLSSGRIPTVKCYRYYARHLMPRVELSGEDIARLEQLIGRAVSNVDADLVMGHIASVLSQVTDLIGVALSPVYDQGVFHRLEIVTLGGNRHLLVISFRSGMVKTIKVTVEHDIDRQIADETALMVTQRLSGLTFGEIRRSIVPRMQGIQGGSRELFDVILAGPDRIFSQSPDHDLYVSGLSRVLSHRPGIDDDCSRKLIDLFENKSDLSTALRGSLTGESEVSVCIGGTILGPDPALALVSAVYHSQGSSGVIGVVGPTRVPYPRLTALIRLAAEAATKSFGM